MKTFAILLLTFIVTLAQDQSRITQQTPMVVGQIVPGTIDPTLKNQNLHPIKIQKLQRKYLFIRLSTYDTNKAAIGLYQNQNGNLVFSCMDNAYDTCYIPVKILNANTLYTILVMSNQRISYNIYTYWGNLEHLKPNQQIKFMFDQKDKTQLFHLELQKQNFQQIRILLRPQTMRNQGDSLKIFAKYGLKEEPTQNNYDFKSVHVWNDIEAVFINKQDIGDHKGVGVYIVGNAKTVYILSCEFIRQKVHNLNLNQNIYQYIKSRKQAIYHMKFDESQQIDVHVVRFSVFTGQAQVGFFYDKEMKNYFKELPFQYMSDLQFHIQKSDLVKGTKEIYMRVRALDTSNTFQLNVQGRRKSLSFEMFQNVYEFVPIRGRQSMFFYSHVWDESQYDRQRQQTFDVSVIKVEGKYEINFYLCKPNNLDQEICKKNSNQDFYKNVVKLNPIGSSQIGSKHIYSVQISQNQYKRINSVQKRALVIIQLVPSNQKQISFAAIQFSNTKKIRILRQGRAFQDKVSLGQIKYYKYENINPNVSMIKIHINQISGLTQISAYRSDNRNILNQSKAIKLSSEQPNTIVITQNITKPVFIKIFGIVSSIYTVTVNPVHKDHPLSSSLIMAEDIEYELKLLPYEYTNIEIHPIEQFVVFQFSCEGGSIIVCQINSQDMCIQNTKIVKNKGKLQIDSSNRRQIRFRLANNVQNDSFPKGGKQLKQLKKSPTNELIRTVKVTLLYHASGKKHCQQRKVNNVYSQIVKSGQCFKFPLPLAQDIQILSNKQNLLQSQSKIQFYLCSRKINVPDFINNRYRISGNLVAEKCQDLPNDIVLTIVVSDETAHEKQVNQYRMDYTVEYNNDIITLIDGVAYFVKTSSLQEQVRTFFYDIVDEQSPIQIQLLNKKGYQQFFAKVVNKIDRYNNKLNEAKTTLNSVNMNFFSNPTISISTQDIANSKCKKNCMLVISVISKQKPGTEIQFGIQVTQHQIILKQNQIRNDFLGKGSFKYYQYHSRNSPTDLLFKLSDNNRRCAKSYLSNHPYPSLNNYIASEQEGTLTYKNANKSTYYFAVQARNDCPYTISVSEGKSILTKIQHSQYYDINLKQNQQEWFYLKHLSKSSFKITSLLKFGSVDISINSTTLNIDTINAVSNGKIKSEQFKFRNQYKNSLTVNSDSKDFCFNCYYLVNIKAKVLTEGSIFLGSEASKIQLTESKIFFDQIKENQTTLAMFYRVSQGNILVNIYSGKIKIQMRYQNQIFTGNYTSDKKIYNQTYGFQRIPQKYTPIQIKIEAQSGPAVYSLQLLPKSESTTEIILYPGQSKFLKMEKGVNACFTGTLRSKKQEILVITDSEQNINLKQIKIDSKLNNKQAQIIRQIVGNILSIKFDIKQTFFPEAISYSICLSSNETKNLYQVTFSIIQTQSMNLLASDTQLIVRNESLFTIHHNGYVIVDIFECDGKAEVIYGSNSTDLDKKSTHFLDIIGIPGQNHAIRVQSKQVLFLKINVPLGTLLWMPLNQKKQRGVGYFKYSIGKIGYSTSFNTIQFKIGGIFKQKQTNTSVQSVKYTLYVSNSRESLQKGVMCEISNQKKMLQVSINSTKIGEGVAPQITASVQKRKFTQKFDGNQTIYFNVVADMILNPPNQDQQHQHYRFVYFQQVVVAELLRQNSLQNLDIKWLIALIIVAATAIIIVLCVLVRCVVPALGRLKGRVLVQENNQDKDVNLQPPPSSDRNQMSAGTSEAIK